MISRNLAGSFRTIMLKHDVLGATFLNDLNSDSIPAKMAVNPNTDGLF